jgi:hypothetical protein
MSVISLSFTLFFFLTTQLQSRRPLFGLGFIGKVIYMKKKKV